MLFQPKFLNKKEASIKRQGEISLERHCDRLELTRSFLLVKGNLAARLSRKLRLLRKSILTVIVVACKCLNGSDYNYFIQENTV